MRWVLVLYVRACRLQWCLGKARFYWHADTIYSQSCQGGMSMFPWVMGFLPLLTVDRGQVLHDLPAHRCPFSSPTCCHPWSQPGLVLAGSCLIIKLHSCCFFLDCSSNLFFPPSLTAWPQRWSYSSFTPWVLVSWSPTALIAFSPCSAVLWLVAKATLCPSLSTALPHPFPNSITPEDCHWVSCCRPTCSMSYPCSKPCPAQFLLNCSTSTFLRNEGSILPSLC